MILDIQSEGSTESQFDEYKAMCDEAIVLICYIALGLAQLCSIFYLLCYSPILNIYA